MSPTVVLALALVAAPVLAIAAIARRRALLMALPFLAALNGLPIPIGASSVRLDQIAACLLVVPLVASWLAGTRRPYVDATTRWLGAILAMNVVATLLHSPSRAYSLLQCANLAAVWVIAALLPAFLDTRDELDAFVRRLLWAGAAACAIGVVAFALAVVGLPVGGAEVSRGAVEHLTNAFGAYGTMVEPNILGSFAAAHLVLAVGLLGRGHGRIVRWLAALSATALVLSFTRAAWLGAVVGLVMLALMTSRALGTPLVTRRWRMPAIALGAAVVVLALLPGSAGTLFRFKLLNLVNLESQTATLRLITYGLALQQTAAHPVVGWGTFTFAPLVAQGNDFQQFDNWRNLWIGNWLLLALHDTGVLGAALWIGMLATVLRRGLRAARALGASPLGTRTLALTAAVASLLIPFLATTGFSLGYPWLLIGLLGAHVSLAHRHPECSEGPRFISDEPRFTPESEVPPVGRNDGSLEASPQSHRAST